MSSTSPPSVTVKVIAGPHAGLTASFESPGTIVVGRASDAQLRLDRDRLISRRHFALHISPPTCHVKDLDSTNGTFVNGAHVSEIDLRDGDEVGGGETRILVRIRSSCEETSAMLNFEARSELTITRASRIASGDAEASAFSSPRNLEFERIAEYKVVRELGRGAMGRVLLACHMGSRQKAAVKLITTPDAAQNSGMQLFLREASVLSRLHHPRIVAANEFGIFEQIPYLVMEYVPVIEWDDLLASRSRAEKSRIACWVVCQALEAIQHAHENHIVHRDIKPSNILAYRGERHLHIKLSDFGLAKNYLSAGFSAISSDGDVRGTLAYMSPEQLTNCRYCKPSCDIYAAGACLYRLLGGSVPYNTSNTSEAIRSILEGTPTPLTTLVPELPKTLVRIVERSMNRDPEKRFQSAEQMRQALLPFTTKSQGTAR